VKLRGADPVGSAFVFLQLLEGQAQGGGQLRLAGAGQLSAQADSMADINIDGVGGCVGQVGALQEVTYRDEAGALLGRCGAPYSFRRWGAAAQAAFNALVAELNPFAPRRSTLILSPALGGKAGRDPCVALTINCWRKRAMSAAPIVHSGRPQIGDASDQTTRGRSAAALALVAMWKAAGLSLDD
jgi:hypothetical protein